MDKFQKYEEKNRLEFIKIFVNFLKLKIKFLFF